MTPSPGACSDCEALKRRVRVLLVALAIMVGATAGLVGGILAVAAGGNLASAFTTGSIAFAGTVTLALLVENALGVLHA